MSGGGSYRSTYAKAPHVVSSFCRYQSSLSKSDGEHDKSMCDGMNRGRPATSIVPYCMPDGRASWELDREIRVLGLVLESDERMCSCACTYCKVMHERRGERKPRRHAIRRSSCLVVSPYRVELIPAGPSVRWPGGQLRAALWNEMWTICMRVTWSHSRSEKGILC